MSVRNETTKLFTSTYDNFIQTAGIRDGVSHYAKILSIFYDSLDTTDLNDPEVIMKIDVSNSFNSTCRVLTLDILSGRASRDYTCDLKRGDTIANNETDKHVPPFWPDTSGLPATSANSPEIATIPHRLVIPPPCPPPQHPRRSSTQV